jgi:PAS domain-containing protein
MANDINGAIITKKLKIPVIGGKPPVKNFYHLNGVVADPDGTRCFLSPISSITIDFYVHTRHRKIKIRLQCYQNSLPLRDTEVNLHSLSQSTLSGFKLSTLKIIMDVSPVGIVDFGSDARIVYANPLAEQLFGKSTTEALGIKCGDFIDCANRHMDFQGCGHTKSCPAFADCRVRHCVLDTFESGTSRPDIEAWLPIIQGESIVERCLLISTAYLEFDSTERVLVCSQDITDRKKTEEELKKREFLLNKI